MGCCCSSESEDIIEDGDINERSRLLHDTNGGNYQSSGNYNDYGDSYSRSDIQRADEQSELEKILQNTARKYIAVGTLDGNTIEKHEQMERKKLYDVRLHNLDTPLHLRKKDPTGLSTSLLSEVASVERTHNESSNSVESSIHLLESHMDRVLETLDQIQVEHRDDLVIHIGDEQQDVPMHC